MDTKTEIDRLTDENARLRAALAACLLFAHADDGEWSVEFADFIERHCEAKSYQEATEMIRRTV